ncbi:MAG: serine/threonine protein kinase [Acidobacteria bacterium]|nr:serine/threonine protein kinase [Acidobacteriota bacterium]MXZ69907.1 serine/threonine protein kinase [Acidobacteriota bacterium]MYJ04870.1 serine/threonine protein kinase [Acidobacteriota bacterium]
MDVERWRRINNLFHAALDQEPQARDAYLDEACGGDGALREEVQSLLDAHAKPSVVDRPALEADPGLLRHDEGSAHDAPGMQDVAGADDPLIGQSLGPYEVTGLLGRGGMGVVYRGFDTRLGRLVAIKALPPAFGDDAVLRARLRREATSAAALSHPGIATVYALEEFERHLYLVYEYVPGRTLRDTLRDRDALLSIDDVLAIARAIARALAAAHAGGVVHRDLKPENVMHLPDGQTKVVDFGIAWVETNEGERLTRPGEPPGTPGYVAPEILRGEPASPRADQFSFGVVLYELLTGNHPFLGSDGSSTIARILEHEPPAIDPERPDCPRALARIVMTCLAKTPGDRYAATDDLVAALEGAVSPAQAQAEAQAQAPKLPAPDPKPTLRSARWWWQFHQVAVTAVYGLALYPMWRAREWVPDGWGLLVFMAAVAIVFVAINLRLHLWFTSRVYPAQLAEQRRRSAVWKRLADSAFALLTLGTAAGIAPGYPRWAALLIALAISSVLSSRVIEPTTERAAFPSD